MNKQISNPPYPAGGPALAGWVWRMKLDPLLRALSLPAPRSRPARLSPGLLSYCTRLCQLKPTERLPLGEYLQFFTDLARELGDPCLGARIGVSGLSPVLSPLRELFLNAHTLHDALLELNHSTPALQDDTQTSMCIEGTHVHVNYQVSARVSGVMARQDVEYSLGLLVQAIRARLGADWCPQAVHLHHGVAEHERQELGRIFGVDMIVDGAERNGIVFPAHCLAHRQGSATHDESVLSFFRQYVHDLCAEHTCHGLQGRVRNLLEAQLEARTLHGQVPSLEWAAARLHLSARSLQRKLALENTSFSSILDDVRHTLALKWMRQQHLPMGALAEYLGYANHAAFCNAFKRRAGVAPSRYQRALQNTACMPAAH